MLRQKEEQIQILKNRLDQNESMIIPDHEQTILQLQRAISEKDKNLEFFNKELEAQQKELIKEKQKGHVNDGQNPGVG